MTTGLLLAFCFGAAPIQAWGGLFNRFNPSLMSDIYGDGSYGKELYRASEGNGRPAATKVRMSVVKRGFCLCPKIVLIKHIAQWSEELTKPPWSSEQIEVILSFWEAFGYILSRKGFINIFKA